MEITFDTLPNAVNELNTKLDRIEALLLQKGNEHPPAQDELLTVQGAAEFLSLSVPTVYGLISKGELPVMKRSKRCYFSRVELIDYLKEGRKSTNAELSLSAKSHSTRKNF